MFKSYLHTKLGFWSWNQFQNIQRSLVFFLHTPKLMASLSLVELTLRISTWMRPCRVVELRIDPHFLLSLTLLVEILNRHGVAGAVLQTPPLHIHLFIDWVTLILKFLHNNFTPKTLRASVLFSKNRPLGCFIHRVAMSVYVCICF